MHQHQTNNLLRISQPSENATYAILWCQEKYGQSSLLLSGHTRLTQ